MWHPTNLRTRRTLKLWVSVRVSLRRWRLYEAEVDKPEPHSDDVYLPPRRRRWRRRRHALTLSSAVVCVTRNSDISTNARSIICKSSSPLLIAPLPFARQYYSICHPWWKYFSEFLKNYLRFSHFSIFWEILGDFSDFFKKFSIVSENYRMRNLRFEEKRRNIRFLKNSNKSLPFSQDISYFLRIRWDWETKNSRKIGEILRLKNSEKNLIFSANNFYFNRIQQNWEHDNFEKIKGTSNLGNFESLIFVS